MLEGPGMLSGIPGHTADGKSYFVPTVPQPTPLLPQSAMVEAVAECHLPSPGWRPCQSLLCWLCSQGYLLSLGLIIADSPTSGQQFLSLTPCGAAISWGCADPLLVAGGIAGHPALPLTPPMRSLAGAHFPLASPTTTDCSRAASLFPMGKPASSPLLRCLPPSSF